MCWVSPPTPDGKKAILSSTDYDNALRDLAQAGRDLQSSYESLVLHDIAAAADLFAAGVGQAPSHDGYVSIEVRPTLAHDTAGTVAEEPRHSKTALSRPNIMIKVPGTPEGIPTPVETLIGEGINVNVTLLFAIQAYEAAAQAYIAGLQRRAAAGGDISSVASVASFFVRRVDTSVDRQLEALIARRA